MITDYSREKEIEFSNDYGKFTKKSIIALFGSSISIGLLLALFNSNLIQKYNFFVILGMIAIVIIYPLFQFSWFFPIKDKLVFKFNEIYFRTITKEKIIYWESIKSIKLYLEFSDTSRTKRGLMSGIMFDSHSAYASKEKLGSILFVIETEERKEKITFRYFGAKDLKSTIEFIEKRTNIETQEIDTGKGRSIIWSWLIKK